jgi:CubicO group peptidase (beta-lactamase class C family)
MVISPRRGVLVPLALAAAVAAAPSRAEAPPTLEASVDEAAAEVLAATGVPSASVAVVRDGAIFLAKAYGRARLEPEVAARPQMRYAIGSVSKQFTATAILLLAEEGKLSLDDRVARFLPDLTRAADVTVRQLLSHTSGYQDYWPQDYVPPFMLQPTTAEAILDRWARRPLDFEPGAEYQYSNTGYVIAGLVVEKASGETLLAFLRRRVFEPLGMQGVVDVDRERLAETDATGYLRYALGPPRPAPKEGPGWLFAAGELAMTAGDLARWNVGMIERKLLKPASYREMQSAVRLNDGLAVDYGLGVDVRSVDGRRVIAHGGEVSGFTAENRVYPDDRAAITVLANQDSSGATGALADRIARLLFDERDSAAAAEARVLRLIEDLQKGRLDRSELTPNASAYFTDQAVADFAASLGPLGAPTSVKQTRRRHRGGMVFRLFQVTWPKQSAQVWERDLPDGKVEQFQVLAAD